VHLSREGCLPDVAELLDLLADVANLCILLPLDWRLGGQFCLLGFNGQGQERSRRYLLEDGRPLVQAPRVSIESHFFSGDVQRVELRRADRMESLCTRLNQLLIIWGNAALSSALGFVGGRWGLGYWGRQLFFESL